MKSKEKMYLSKSLFIRGLQCHKSLFLDRYHPDLRDEMTESQETLFESGREVGRLAQNLFPGGIEIPYEGLTHQEQIDLTWREINSGTDTLYEAAFSFDGVFVKVDILHRGRRGWEIYEVKASTSLKDVHIPDIAVQYYVVTGSGLSVTRASLVHINNEYVRQGAIRPNEIFCINDLTETVTDMQPSIRREIRNQQEMLRGNQPDIDIGPYCDDPYTCDFKGQCWKHIPENSVFDLRGKRVKLFELYQRGFLSMYDVPASYLSTNQEMQVRANMNKEFRLDRDAVAHFLYSLKYPIYFLDFETFMMAIPPYDGIRPYQQVPFQYSLHCLEGKGAELKHYEYLALPRTDPRKDLIKKLVAEIPAAASILVYNKTFETGVFRNLALWCPQYSQKIEKIIDNIVDLMPLFRNRQVYHWRMNGSYSLKEVVAALLPELAYNRLDIQDGGMAMNAYFAMNQSKDPGEVESIRKSLMEYCGLDTMVMVGLWEKLKQELSPR